ncbi:MAG TPA: hypothetical protein VK502_02430 [Candidatus Saccharimonadales bacterium]|nr:hypothetical protein [Candidatus Saccharimonadales bacterium]
MIQPFKILVGIATAHPSDAPQDMARAWLLHSFTTTSETEEKDECPVADNTPPRQTKD